jgi:hypothetical protein
MSGKEEIEERECTCGAGHGSLEGHMAWCAWLVANPVSKENAMTEAVIHAFTGLEPSYPPYINITRLDGGSVRVIVRTHAGPNGIISEIIMSEADWRSLAWSVYSENEDYMREHGRPVPKHGSGP